MKLQRFGNRKTQWWGYGGDAGDLLSMLNVPGGQRPDPVECALNSSMVPFIDPFLKITGNRPLTTLPWEIHETLSPTQYDICKTLRCEPRPRIGIDWEQLNATPEAIRFQMSHRDQDCIAPEWAFEIGRFITKQNEIGIIKSIQTGITFESNDYRWPRGDSLWHTRDLDINVGQADIRWALTVESVQDGQPDPKNFRYIDLTAATTIWVDNLPGSVHPELMPWQSMIFPWGADNEVRLRCPPGTLVSLWVFEPFTTYDPGIRYCSGMLKGYTQIMGSDRTYENMTRSY